MTTSPLGLLRWSAVLAAALVLWSAALPVPGGRRLDTLVPFTQLAAARPPLVLAFVVVGLLAVWRSWRIRRGLVPSTALLLVAAAAGLQVAPRARSSSAPTAERTAGLTLVTANTLRSGVHPETIVGLVRRTGADVLTLPETNRDTAERYARALGAATGGAWRAVSDAEHAPDDRTAAPTSVVVRRALGPVRLPAGRQGAGEHGRVRVRLQHAPGGRAMTIVAVHPRPPAPLEPQAAWRGDLLALAPLCRDSDVVAGDLNATIDHSPLRTVLRDGCRDAAAETGQGLRATWSGGPLGMLRPTIDHVLTGPGRRASASGVLALRGSDHRAVWARVVRRGRD